MEIKLTKAILHILDTKSSLPVYSQQELDLSEESISNFVTIHIKKIFKDRSVRIGEFKDQSPIINILDKLDNSFIDNSIAIAELLYEIMKRNIDIPSADLLIAMLEINGIPHLAILKFNYKIGFTHHIEYNEMGVKNEIIVHNVIFASQSQKIDEGALINLKELSIKVIENEYLIDGEKRNYFSQYFLGCKTNLSQKESLKVINDVASDINRKYYNNSFEKKADIKSAIYDILEEKGTIDIEEIAESSFSDNQQIKTEYIKKVKEAGVNKIEFFDENPERKFNKYKIKIDNGIELNIPMELYKNKEIVEFINNPNGTISIVIKQINKIINK